MRHAPHVHNVFYRQPWAILPEKLAEINAFANRWMRGEIIADAEKAAIQAAARSTQSPQQGVAVLPIFGVISYRANLLTEFSGGTSIDRASKAFAQAVNSPDVGTVVLNIDSPGGTVDGVPEFADQILAAR